MLTYQLFFLAKSTHASHSSSYPVMPSIDQPGPEEACLPIASQSGTESGSILHERRLSASVVFLHRMCIVEAWFAGFVELCELTFLALTMSWE